MAEMISFNPENFEQLKKEYQVAVDAGMDIFMFDGQYEMLVSYAKYLIEYLEGRFKLLEQTS